MDFSFAHVTRILQRITIVRLSIVSHTFVDPLCYSQYSLWIITGQAVIFSQEVSDALQHALQKNTTFFITPYATTRTNIMAEPDIVDRAIFQNV